MKTETMKYNKNSYFTGRNGCFIQSGIELRKILDNVVLTPITGKHKRANCCVTVPIEQINEFINLLQKFENPA